MKEVLQMCLDSDAIVIGTPIYYGSISSSAQAFLERLLFAADTYVLDEDGNRVSKIKKEIKTTMIYTMNLYAYDTKQFKKHDPYLNNMFDPELKEKSKEVQFPKDCAKAFDLGKRLSDE